MRCGSARPSKHRITRVFRRGAALRQVGVERQSLRWKRTKANEDAALQSAIAAPLKCDSTFVGVAIARPFGASEPESDGGLRGGATDSAVFRSPIGTKTHS